MIRFLKQIDKLILKLQPEIERCQALLITIFSTQKVFCLAIFKKNLLEMFKFDFLGNY